MILFDGVAPARAAWAFWTIRPKKADARAPLLVTWT
jgi:hypothetical protein